jgi:hypothetical protein
VVVVAVVAAAAVLLLGRVLFSAGTMMSPEVADFLGISVNRFFESVCGVALLLDSAC